MLSRYLSAGRLPNLVLSTALFTVRHLVLSGISGSLCLECSAFGLKTPPFYFSVLSHGYKSIGLSPVQLFQLSLILFFLFLFLISIFSSIIIIIIIIITFSGSSLLFFLGKSRSPPPFAQFKWAQSLTLNPRFAHPHIGSVRSLPFTLNLKVQTSLHWFFFFCFTLPRSLVSE